MLYLFYIAFADIIVSEFLCKDTTNYSNTQDLDVKNCNLLRILGEFVKNYQKSITRNW